MQFFYEDDTTINYSYLFESFVDRIETARQIIEELQNVLDRSEEQDRKLKRAIRKVGREQSILLREYSEYIVPRRLGRKFSYKRPRQLESTYG